MVQINMRIFKIIALLTISTAPCIGVPFLRAEHRGDPEGGSDLLLDGVQTLVSHQHVKDLKSDAAELEDTFDQRQNGSENYRIHVDGLVVVVAPVEALLLAGGASNNFSSIVGHPQEKPEKPMEPTLKPIIEPADGDKPLEPKKISHRGHLKLGSLLAPFLRQFGPH